MTHDEPFAVADLWRSWQEEDGNLSYSFSQITINADDHPLLRRMHKPGDKKRNLVIVPASDYDAWLNCRNTELARTSLQNYPAEHLQATPAPRRPVPPLTDSLL